MESSFKKRLVTTLGLLVLTFGAASITPARAAGNLVGYWTLDDGIGATVADSSGYGHPGVLTGGGWSASHAPTAFANSGSLSLNASSGQGINAPQVTTATDNLSMSIWANWAGANVLGQMLIYNGDSGPNGYGIYLQPNGELGILNGGVAIASSSTFFKLTVGIWQNVVAMRDAGIWKLYVDGNPVALNGNPVPNPPAGHTSIGRSVTAGNTFNGLIDDVRIYDRVLTASEFCSPGITVTNGNDSGAGSLRQAIAGLCSGGRITFDNNYTILLATELVIAKDLTIDGTGYNVAVSGNRVTRVLNITGGTIALNHLTIANGYFDAGHTGDSGAGVCVNGGTLSATNCTFSGNTTGWPGGGGIHLWVGAANVDKCTFVGNSADYGGGIDSFSGTTLTVMNSTFSGNSATSAGGAMSVGGVGTITNCTISGNSSGWAGGGGGINSEYGTVTIYNSIFANNPTGNNCWSHYGGPFYGSNNLADDDTGGAGFTKSASILLGTLGNYGGSTQTFPLLPGSSAIDAGDSAIGAAAPVNSLDQRGVTRPAACDIGAFESQGFTLTKTGGDSQSTALNTAFATPLALSVTSSSGEPVNGGVVAFTAPGSGASTNPATNTATISGGSATQSVTANGAPGSYNVAASTTCATSVNFSLTNTAPYTDLAITVTATPNPVENGGNLTYTLSVSNNKTQTASAPSVANPLPSGTTFVSASSTDGWTIASPAVGNPGTVTFSKSSLTAGASDQLTLVVKVNPSVTTGTVIANTATISSSTTDSDTSNNSSTATTTVTQANPTVTTQAATSVTGTAATLNGTVNAQNASTTVTFEYGLTTGYGTTVSATPATVTGTSSTSVSAKLASLTPNTTYHFRAVGGSTSGPDQSFTTAAMAPIASTGTASNITDTGTTLAGTVNAQNASTAVTFEYGPTIALGSSAAGTPSPLNGMVDTATSVSLNGLAPLTKYYYRVKGVSIGGTTPGTTLSFTTLPLSQVTVQSPIPSHGSVGKVVTLMGSRFALATSVVIGGMEAMFTVVSDTEITCIVPPGAVTGPIRVTSPAGTGSSTAFTVDQEG